MADRLIHQPLNEEFDLPELAKRRRRIVAGIVTLLGLVLLLLGYTQTKAFGQFLLRKTSKELGAATISAESFRLIGASRLTGEALKMVGEGGETIFECRSIDLGFSLISWMRGEMALTALQVEKGRLEVLEDGDGESPLGSLWSQLSKRRRHPRTPLRGVDLEQVQLKECVVQFKWEARPEVLIELGEIELTCPGIRPGADSALEVSTRVSLVSDATSQLTFLASGALDLNLRETGMPKIADGVIDLEFGQGQGSFSDLSDAIGEIKLAVQPGEIKTSGLRLSREGRGLGAIEFSGPFDSKRMEGRLTITTEPLRRPFLNLWSVVSGLDFGETELQATTTLDWAFGGSVISGRGSLTGTDLELLKATVRTPKTEVSGEYSFQYSEVDESLLLQKCDFRFSSDAEDWLTCKLESPVLFSWGDARPGIKEPEFEVVLKEVDMQAWASFFLLDLPPGLLSLDAQSVVKRDGQVILSDVAGQVNGLEIETPVGRPLVADVNFSFDSQLDDLKRLSLTDVEYSLKEDGEDVVMGDGVFSIQFDSADYSLQLVSQGAVDWISGYAGVEGLVLDRGAVDSMIRVVSKNGAYDVVSNLGVTDLFGRYLGLEFEDHRLEAKLDMKLTDDRLLLNNFTVEARKGYTGAGSIGFNGQYDLDAETGDVRFQSVGINRHLLGSLLNGYLEPERLGLVELQVEGQAQFNRSGEGQMTGTVGVKQLGKLEDETDPGVPLDFELGGEIQVSEQSVRIPNGSLQLAVPASGADNLVNFEANFPRANVVDQDRFLELDAGALDVSEYWAWYQRLRSPNPSPAAPQGVGIDGAESVNGLGTLPVELRIDLERLVLGKLAVTNLVATSTISRGLWVVDSLDANVNGGKLEGTIGGKERGGAIDLTIDLALEEIPVVPPKEDGDGDEEVPENGMEGTLNAALRLDGRLGKEPGVKTVLNGRLDATVSAPAFPGMEAKRFAWLAPVLKGLRLPSIEDLDFERFHGGIKFDGPTATIEDLSLDGNLVKLRSAGSIQWGSPWDATELDMPVEVWMEASAMETAGLPDRGVDAIEGFGQLPSLLSIGGSLNAPRMQVNRLALTKLVLETVGNGGGVRSGVGSTESEENRQSEPE